MYFKMVGQSNLRKGRKQFVVLFLETINISTVSGKKRKMYTAFVFLIRLKVYVQELFNCISYKVYNVHTTYIHYTYVLPI